MPTYSVFLGIKESGNRVRCNQLGADLDDRWPTSLTCVIAWKKSHPSGNLLSLIYLSISTGIEMARSYTPICSSLAGPEEEGEKSGRQLYLMMKIYADGVLTPTLNTLQPGGCDQGAVKWKSMIDCLWNVVLLCKERSVQKEQLNSFIPRKTLIDSIHRWCCVGVSTRGHLRAFLQRLLLLWTTVAGGGGDRVHADGASAQTIPPRSRERLRPLVVLQ